MSSEGNEIEVTGWHRSPARGRVAGVCQSIAERYRVDPLLVRAAAILLALASGIGVVLYASAWLMVPVEGRSETSLDHLYPASREWPLTTRLLVVAIAVLTVAAMTSSTFGIGPWPALVLLAVFAMVRRRRSEAEVAPGVGWTPLPDSPFSQALLAWHQRLDELDLGQAGVVVPVNPWADPEYTAAPWPAAALSSSVGPVAAPVGAPAVAPSRRRTRPSLWVSLGTLVLAAVAGSIPFLYAPWAERADILGAGLALAVVAAGLLVGTFIGRPRLLIAGGLACVLWMATPVLQSSGRGGDVHLHYTSASQLAEPVDLAGAKAVIDLRDLDLAANAELEVQARASNVVVLVPSDVTVELDYELRAANLTVNSQGRDQLRVAGAAGDDLVLEAAANSPRLVIDLQATAASVEVLR